MEVTEPKESPCLDRLGPPDPDPGLGAIPRVWGEPLAVKGEHQEWREGPEQVTPLRSWYFCSHGWPAYPTAHST